jgi:2-oxoglutarate dehydrogenase E2 component (dihydrolipoamide succinyltransferase)
VLEADLTPIARLRAAHKRDFLERTGTKLSFLPFFAKAAIAALPEHPVLNASLDSEVTEVTFHDAVHLGIAVDSPKGLMVPVIKNAESATIARLATSIAEAADKVRSSSITVDELNGGTFTITNTGSRGALFDTPIINHPQTGILGVGAVVERLVPVRDHDDSLRIEVRAMAYLSLTYDHRIVDGADAASFLTSMKERLETGFRAADLTL